MSFLKILTTFFGLFGAGRSPATVLNLLAPRRGYQVHRDIPYGAGPRHRLDLYVPDALQPPAPVVLFFYGGAFQAGWKGEYRVVGEALASKGIIVAIADYRIHPEIRFPDFLKDGAKAFVVLRGLVMRYGGAAARIFLAGTLVRVYIPLMLVVDPF